MALKAISQEQTAVNEFLREFVKEVLKKARLLTPTPGGIGPITVALLLQNTARCAR
jgi:5,10-methylene-tetrahydrofolate dehydrogenase/methenyl tetrahydrofolate cyclohydrolase